MKNEAVDYLQEDIGIKKSIKEKLLAERATVQAKLVELNAQLDIVNERLQTFRDAVEKIQA